MPTALQRDLLLFTRRGVTWLLRVEFSTADAAPINDPYVGEVGQLATTDTGSNASVSGGELVMASSVGARDPWIRETAGRLRVVGRAMFLRYKRVSGSGSTHVGGWSNTLSSPDAPQTYGGIATSAPATSVQPEGVVLQDASALNVYNKFVFVLRSTGCHTFIDGKLAWPGLTGSEATLYPHFMPRIAGAAATSDWVRVRDLGGAFATDYGIATLHSTSPVSGTPVTGEANGITDLYFTLTGAPSANQIGAQLDYRRQDASNYWSAYIKRNAGNTAWDFFLDSVSAGTPTNQLSVTGVGTPDMLRVIHDGNLHDAYTKVTTTFTKRGAQVTNVAFSTQTGVVPTAGAGGSISQLDIWARSSGLYSVLDLT